MVMAKSRNKLAPKLRRLRAALELSQADAAEKAGVAKQTWVNWENGERGPGKHMLRLLRTIFPGHL